MEKVERSIQQIQAHTEKDTDQQRHKMCTEVTCRIIYQMIGGKVNEVIKSYKGFNRDLTCRGKQYEVGKEYEEDRAQSCECGMHACEYPLDCFSYYDPAHSVYYEVEQSGDLSRRGDDSKVASTKMKIRAEINIAGMVKASINYIRERIKEEKGSDDAYGASSADTREHRQRQETTEHRQRQGTREHRQQRIQKVLPLLGDTKDE